MEFNEIEKTDCSTMQEFDFTDITTENRLSEIAEELSPEETAAAIVAIQNIQNEHNKRKGQNFNAWFDAAFLPILKNFAALNGSKLIIRQDSLHDITVALTSRCGFDITAEQKHMHMVLAAADHISVTKWSDSDMVELTFLFAFSENE